MNKSIIIGHIGKDAETKEVNGRTVINLTVAVTKKYVSNGSTVEKTTWFDCAYWMQKLESAQKLAAYLLKGSKVAVEGEADSRAWKNNNGEPQSTNLITASNVEILVSTKDKNQSSAPPQNQQQNTNINTNPGEDDDLPF